MSQDLNAQIIEARNAMHSLITGNQVVRSQKDGRSVEYTATRKRDL
jgi:hypothetical protein